MSSAAWLLTALGAAVGAASPGLIRAALARRARRRDARPADAWPPCLWVKAWVPVDGVDPGRILAAVCEKYFDKGYAQVIVRSAPGYAAMLIARPLSAGESYDGRIWDAMKDTAVPGE